MEQFSVTNIAKIQVSEHTGSEPAAVGSSDAQSEGIAEAYIYIQQEVTQIRCWRREPSHK